MKNEEKGLVAARQRVQTIQKVPYPKAELRKYFARRKEEENKKFKEHKKDFEEKSRFIKTISAPFLELIGQDKRRELVRAFEQRAKQRPVPRVKRPEMEKVEPRITAGSILSVLAPPFWNDSKIENGDAHVEAHADQGSTEMFVAGNSGSSSASGGVQALFSPVSDMPVGKFRPFINRYFDYHEECFGYTAHTTGTLSVRVQEIVGLNIQVGSFQQTLWNDGVGWIETHDAPAQSGDWQWAGFIEVSFPLVRGLTYALTVDIGATADDNGADLIGYSLATATLAMSVPFMIVEETTG